MKSHVIPGEKLRENLIELQNQTHHLFAKFERTNGVKIESIQYLKHLAPDLTDRFVQISVNLTPKKERRMGM